MLCGLVGGGLPWRSLFLQRLSRPMFGATLRTYFGTYGVFRGPFCEPIFGTMVLGSLIQGHRIMNRWPSFVVHKTDPKVGPLTQRLGP